jgi:hypothetical protein
MRFKVVTVITFNYDIGAEVAFELQSLPYDYCVCQPVPSGNLVKFLKLHGSINWGQDLSSNEINPISVQSLLSNPDLGQIITDQSITHLPLEVSPHYSQLKANSPVIVPPGLCKTEYQGSISTVWQEAAKELESAKEIIVIGYSLPETDFFFRNLYALGTVGKDPIRRFAVFNPEDFGLVEGRFKSLLGSGAKDRFEYHADTFGSAINVMRDWYL